MEKKRVYTFGNGQAEGKALYGRRRNFGRFCGNVKARAGDIHKAQP